MNSISIHLRDVGKTYTTWENPAARARGAFRRALGSLLDIRGTGMARSAANSREFHALKGINLSIRRGETVGIIGKNGSGKSTLLQIVAGTLSPSVGEVTVTGRVAALLELGSGFNPDFTGLENIFLNAAILGLTHEEISRKLSAIVAFADIGEFISQPVKTYSSGMAMRLAFSVIAHVDADILIVDEALAVGDIRFVNKCMAWIRDFKERGTLLFVGHNIGDIISLCDRVIWLDGGAMAAEGLPKTVCEDYLAWMHQGESMSRRGSSPPPKMSLEPRFDARREFRNSGHFRNDIEVFEFDPSGPQYGEGLAKIRDVQLRRSDGEGGLAWIVGGELVRLRIEAVAQTHLENVIVGFYLQNRTGQNLFGDNTYISTLESPLSLGPGDVVSAEFDFQMPYLPKGQFMISPAIASGTQLEHKQQHWIHEALCLESTNSSVIHGLVGIPIHRISTSVKSGSINS